VNFSEADLENANLGNADLRGTGLTSETLEAKGAKFDGDTIFDE